MMGKDKFWFFYSMETLQAYWSSTNPVRFNLDLYEKTVRQKKKDIVNDKRNKKSQVRKERGPMLPFRENVGN